MKNFKVALLIQYDTKYLLGKITYPEVQNYFEYRKYCEIDKNIDIRLISKNGWILSTDLTKEEKHYTEYKPDFIYTLEKVAFFDAFCISLNWLPQRFLTGQLFKQIANQHQKSCHISNLIRNIKTTDTFNFPSHDHSLLIESDKTVFYTFNPNTPLLQPSISTTRKPKIFYIGASDPLLRHGEIFKALDNYGIAEFYGPKEKWKGVKSYKGKLENEKIFKTINKCGITLALHNPIHCEYQIYTNRVFEAIISGSILITDKFEGLNEIFGDTIYSIDTNNDSSRTASEIIRIYNEILDNRPSSIKKIKQSQSILFNNFFKKNWIYDNFKTIENEKLKYINKIKSFSNKSIDIIILLTKNSFSISNLCSCITLCKNQYHNNYKLLISYTEDIYDELHHFLEEHHLDFANINIETYKYNSSSPTTKNITTGSLFKRIIPHLNSDYFTFIDHNSKIHKDHFGRMLFNIKASHRKIFCCYTQVYQEYVNTNEVNSFHNYDTPISLSDLLDINESNNFINTSTHNFLTRFEHDVEMKLSKGCQLFSNKALDLINKFSNINFIRAINDFEHIFLFYLIAMETKMEGIQFVRYASYGRLIPKPSSHTKTKEAHRLSLNTNILINSNYCGSYNCNAAGLYELLIGIDYFWYFYSRFHGNNPCTPPKPEPRSLKLIKSFLLSIENKILDLIRS